MTNIIVIANQKGGVGKTTTSINLAAALSEIGKKTLLVDLDSQGNASSACGLSQEKDFSSVYDLLLGGAEAKECIIKAQEDDFDIIPSNRDLMAAEIQLLELENRELTLKNALQSISAEYDFIIIDSPPSMNILTLNALSFAKHLIIPVQCEYFALEGLGKLLNTIKSIQKIHNPDLGIEGMLLTMYDSRLRLSNQVVDEVKKHFGNMVFNTIIQRNVKLGEAPSLGETIIDYDATSKGASSYLKLAQELINKKK